MSSLSSYHSPLPSISNRRTRHIAGLAPWADARPQYRLRLGGAALPFDALTDEAVVALRSRIAGDIRRERARGCR